MLFGTGQLTASVDFGLRLITQQFLFMVIITQRSFCLFSPFWICENKTKAPAFLSLLFWQEEWLQQIYKGIILLQATLKWRRATILQEVVISCTKKSVSVLCTKWGSVRWSPDPGWSRLGWWPLPSVCEVQPRCWACIDVAYYLSAAQLSLSLESGQQVNCSPGDWFSELWSCMSLCYTRWKPVTFCREGFVCGFITLGKYS